MKKGIGIISVCILLIIPSVTAFESYGLQYVNVCQSFMHSYYCDQPQQATLYPSPFFSPEWRGEDIYREHIPKGRRVALSSRIYSRPIHGYQLGTFTRWR